MARANRAARAKRRIHAVMAGSLRSTTSCQQWRRRHPPSKYCHYTVGMLRSVAVLVLDELAVFEFGVLCEVFGMDRTDDGVPLLDFRVCGVRGGEPVSTTGGVQVVPEHGLDGLRGVDLVAVPATGLREFPAEVLQALRDAAADGATLLTVCSGVFVLGAAGLLDRRRCTAHWRSVDELRERHPAAIVDPDVLFVD